MPFYACSVAFSATIGAAASAGWPHGKVAQALGQPHAVIFSWTTAKRFLIRKAPLRAECDATAQWWCKRAQK
jgi:hypothetical protein